MGGECGKPARAALADGRQHRRGRDCGTGHDCEMWSKPKDVWSGTSMPPVVPYDTRERHGHAAR